MAQLAADAGWRVMSLVLAGTVVVFLPVLALVMRDRPEDLGLARYGDKAGARLSISEDAFSSYQKTSSVDQATFLDVERPGF